MTLAESLLPTLRQARSIPGQLGLRPYSVSVTVRTRSGDYGLEGTATDVTLDILEANGKNPKVRFLREDELAIGDLPTGSVEVGPITPFSATAGGLTFAQLTAQDVAEKTQVRYTLTGDQFPNGAEYRLVASKSYSSLHYMLTLKPVSM